MKVLQVIDTLNTGGAERILVSLSNVLHDNGVDVHVLILVDEGELRDQLKPTIPVNTIKRRSRLDFSKMKEVAGLLKDFSLVHCHLKHNYRYISIIKRIFGINHVKLILHDHSHLLGISKWSAKFIKDLLFKNILKPEYYIGVNKENLHWANSYLKIRNEKCFLLSNTVPRAQRNITVEKGKGKGGVLISNITRIKNIEFAIQLMERIDESLTIFGRVIDDQYYKELIDTISRNKLEEKVQIITDCPNVQPLLHNYKFGLHTSFKETGPLVLIEYLAQGLPFLSFASGGVYDKLRNIVPDMFINNFEIENWESKISKLEHFKPESLQKLYIDFFDIKLFAQECQAIYQKIEAF